MRITRPITVSLLVIGLAVFLQSHSATAKDERAAKPLSALEQEHKRLTEEGERASRARPPSPRPATPPNNGIVQIPIDTTKTTLELKGQRTRPTDVAPPARGRDQLLPRSQSQPQPPLPPPPPPPCFYAPGVKTANLVKAFPEVTWHVCVTDVLHKGLWVGPVDIKRTPTGPWVRVLYQAGLADIFVPYHIDSTLRFYDMRWTQWLDQVTTQDAGLNGSLITLTNETVPTVVAEVRDRGVAWLCKQATAATRRGQEFVVWGVSDAGNYDNIVQVGFRDDGTMTFRMGNTGYNSPSHMGEGHSHNGLWRVDMDLNGSPNDTASWVTHAEPDSTTSPYPLTARDYDTPFGVEGARQRSYSQYAALLIEDAATNAFGNKLGYEFTSVALGMSRHFDYKEAWTQNDVYVTRYSGSELWWLTNWAGPDDYLLTFLNNQTVTNQDLVVWIKSTAHHEPSAEDHSADDLNPILNPPTFTGITLTHWSGFDIEPHNFFSTNPLGAPVKCGL